MPRKKQTNEYLKYIPAALEKEDEFAYALFQAYCLLGDDRRLVKVAAMQAENAVAGHENIEKVAARIKHLSRQFRWVERAKKFDFNRLIAQTDKLIFEQQAIDADWLEKGKKSRELLRDILADSQKIKEANSLLMDAAIARLRNDPELDALVALNKIVNGVANSNLSLCKILAETWQVKEQSEAITVLQNEILQYSESCEP